MYQREFVFVSQYIIKLIKIINNKTECLLIVTAKKGGQYGPVFCPYFPQRRYSVREIYGITTGTVDARNGNKLHGRARREPSISPLYTATARRFLPKGPWIIPYLPSLIRVARCHRIYPRLSSCHEYHYYIQR